MASSEKPRLIDDERLITEVERRPDIWNKSINTNNEASAWREICKLAWPDFHLWSTDVKRTKCLELQKDWSKLRRLFIKEYLRRQQNPGKQQSLLYFDSLSFLIPTIKETEPNGKDELRPAKRARVDQSQVNCNCGRESEEDQKFLLSLVSHMQDVPKASKLALRSEILQLILKYTEHPS